VRCDGALVAQEKMFIDTGSRHDFTIGTGTNPCHVTVLICASGGEYAYELFVERVRFYQALQVSERHIQTPREHVALGGTLQLHLPLLLTPNMSPLLRLLSAPPVFAVARHRRGSSSCKRIRASQTSWSRSAHTPSTPSARRHGGDTIERTATGNAGHARATAMASTHRATSSSSFAALFSILLVRLFALALLFLLRVYLSRLPFVTLSL
jgi:hypothetical protein